jgi:hypothetical protein
MSRIALCQKFQIAGLFLRMPTHRSVFRCRRSRSRSLLPAALLLVLSAPGAHGQADWARSVVLPTRGERYSTMHSAVCALGEKFTDRGDPFSFKGPLLMFCNDWGIWDANRRNRIYPAGHEGVWLNPAEKVGDWNRIEILVLGNRIRMAANGILVFDFTDSPEMLATSPIGLQLHANDRPQEYRFRGLVLAENPTDRLLTLKAEDR